MKTTTQSYNWVKILGATAAAFLKKMPQGKKVYELKNKEEGFLIPLSGFFRITTTLFSWSEEWFWKQEARHWLYVGQRTVET